MTLNNKDDCIISISAGLRGSSQWRTGRDQAFPGDTRNLSAADLLMQLADDAADMSESDWLELRLHYSWASERWTQALSLACRQIGFSRQPKDFSAFVRNLVGILSSQQVAA